MTSVADLIAVAAPALAAAVMIACIHAPLGLEVLRRGVIFVDLAVAQIAGAGLIAARLYMHDAPVWLMQLCALAAALGACALFRRVERVCPERSEAFIGVCYVTAASTALLMLAEHPRGGEHMRDLLSGQILFVSWGELARHAPLYAAVSAAWLRMNREQRQRYFYLLFAPAITSSVQLAGVYVVFASLILPALAAENSASPRKNAVLYGAACAVTGVAVAVFADIPAGPALVGVFALCALPVRARLR